jgi:hypothetical protein
MCGTPGACQSSRPANRRDVSLRLSPGRRHSVSHTWSGGDVPRCLTSGEADRRVPRSAAKKDRSCHQRSRRVAVVRQRVTHCAVLCVQRTLGQPLVQRSGADLESGDVAQSGEDVVGSHGRCSVP